MLVGCPRRGAPLPSLKGFEDGSKTIQFLQPSLARGAVPMDKGRSYHTSIRRHGFGHHQPWSRQAADQAGRLSRAKRPLIQPRESSAVPRAARRAVEGLGSRMSGWKQLFSAASLQ